jgi:hypothetical protein
MAVVVVTQFQLLKGSTVSSRFGCVSTKVCKKKGSYRLDRKCIESMGSITKVTGIEFLTRIEPMHFVSTRYGSIFVLYRLGRMYIESIFPSQKLLECNPFTISDRYRSDRLCIDSIRPPKVIISTRYDVHRVDMAFYTWAFPVCSLCSAP